MRVMAAILLSILVSASPASGRTWLVPGDAPTIQAGIDSAASGDTIIVADGEYVGPQNRDLDFHGLPIVLRSSGGPTACQIDCEGLARGFTFDDGESDAAVVDGFWITNGYIPDQGRGGGIYIEADSSPTIKNCRISNCSAYWGAGIMIVGAASAPTIEWCVIEGNSFSWGGGGGISVSDAAAPVIRHCVIAGNSTGWGPGILVDWNTNVQVIQSTIANNTALASGSARNVTAWHGASIALNSCIVWGGRNQPDRWQPISRCDDRRRLLLHPGRIHWSG